jgi:hypothetical protein
MVITVLKLINRAYKLHGVQNPTTSEQIDALNTFIEMLDTWGTKAYAISVNVKEELTLVASQGTYTLGVGGDLNSARPESIVTVYFQASENDIDIYVRPITEPEYDDITDKTVEGRPTRWFLAPEYPLAKLYLDPVPDGADKLKITSRKPLIDTDLAIGDSLTLPPGYAKAIRFNLAVELTPDTGETLSPVVAAKAVESFNDMLSKNAKPLKMVSDFPRGRRSQHKRPFNIDILE